MRGRRHGRLASQRRRRRHCVEAASIAAMPRGWHRPASGAERGRPASARPRIRARAQRIARLDQGGQVAGQRRAGAVFRGQQHRSQPRMGAEREHAPASQVIAPRASSAASRCNRSRPARGAAGGGSTKRSASLPQAASSSASGPARPARSPAGAAAPGVATAATIGTPSLQRRARRGRRAGPRSPAKSRPRPAARSRCSDRNGLAPARCRPPPARPAGSPTIRPRWSPAPPGGARRSRAAARATAGRRKARRAAPAPRRRRRPAPARPTWRDLALARQEHQQVPGCVANPCSIARRPCGSSASSRRARESAQPRPGKLRPALDRRGASRKRKPFAGVADITTMRRSSRTPACTSSANAEAGRRPGGVRGIRRTAARRRLPAAGRPAAAGEDAW